MPIKWPKMSIADSVVNRIFNAADEAERRMPDPVPPEPSLPQPEIADPVPQSGQLELALEQPVAPVADDAGVVKAAAQGRTPLSGLIDP